MPLLKLSASCKGNPHPQLMLFTPEDTLLCAFMISLALQSWLQRNGRSQVDLLEEYTQKYNDISFKNQSKCVLFIYLCNNNYQNIYRRNRWKSQFQHVKGVNYISYGEPVLLFLLLLGTFLDGCTLTQQTSAWCTILLLQT